MKDIKKFLIAALSFMLLFSVSCSNDNKTGSGEETIYNVVGTWFEESTGKDMIKIDKDSSGNYLAIYYASKFGYPSDMTINQEDVTQNGNTYTVKIGNDTATLTFTSDTKGKSDYKGATTPISKRQ